MIGAQLDYPQNFKSNAFSQAEIWTLEICIAWNLRQNSDVIYILLMTVERIHPKAPVMLIFIDIFTCLPSCINLSNTDVY